MDWIKIKISHALLECKNFTDVQYSSWVKAMALTAMLERLPNDRDFKGIIHGNALNSLRKALHFRGISLAFVLDKVLEDVAYTKDLRKKGKSKMAQWREKKKEKQLSTEGDVTRNVTSTIREDKIREDKGTTEVTVTEGSNFSLINTWEILNKQTLKEYPGFRGKVREAIDTALTRGWAEDDVRARLKETAGQGIKPWDLFKEKPNKEAKRLDEIGRRTEELRQEVQKAMS